MYEIRVRARLKIQNLPKIKLPNQLLYVLEYYTQTGNTIPIINLI